MTPRQGKAPRQGKEKIALEEHCITPDVIEKVTGGPPDPAFWEEEQKRLLDFTDMRLKYMDQSGIAYSILSLTGSAAQGETDTATAVRMARQKNDLLAERISEHRDRLGALAAIPMQHPEAAALELRRAVGDLGFAGALINGFTSTRDPHRARYLEEPGNDVFWAAVEELGVPVYLHPRAPLASQQEAYRDREMRLGSAWAFGVETTAHALRLIMGGVFARFPGAQVILGHLAETLPFAIWRVKHRYDATHRGVELAKPLLDYLRTNFFVTTAGFLDDAALRFTLNKLGTERVLFSTDYPYEHMVAAGQWFDRAPLNDQERQAVGHGNAARLFQLR
jgi:2,3-dihydroxybenzoate decarboxylase